jgi:hypothetical protein
MRGERQSRAGRWLMGTMGNLRVRAVLAACLIAAATAAAAFKSLPRLVDLVAADIGVVLAPRDPPVAPRWFTDHAPSLCCADFNAGLRVALFAVLVGGFPLSLLGISLGTRLRRGEAVPDGRWTRWFYGAFVVQAGSVAIAAFLLLVAAWEALISPIGGEGLFVAALFLPTLICGALALPSWHSVSNQSRRERLTTI